MPVSTVLRDLRALGSSAPMRAVYEASKRTGFHRVLFRDSSAQPRHHSVPLAFGTCIPDSEMARRRCLEDAEEILTQGLRVFGRRVKTGVFAPWAEDPLTGESWQSGVPWWEIDIRSESRLSDVKFVWEAARHRDLVVLARATAIQPDGRWLDGLRELLRNWCAECPPEQGVNWYSSLELALRSIAWCQVLALAGSSLPPTLCTSMDTQLLASARHIMIELPYTVSSMKNNHLLGDGLGLMVLGRMFPTHPRSVRWSRLGDRLFTKQLARHMRPDGSMIEDSLSYHRFVLEMLIVRVLLGDADELTRRAMAGAARHLEAIGVLEGQVPQYGDWDEGRVLADSGPAGSTAGSTWLALALDGSDVPADAMSEHDELAWYAASTPISRSSQSPTPAVVITSGGGFTRVHRNDWTVWFKSGGGPSHQHADLLSLWVKKGEQWIIRDPGTGTYNGPLEVRNGFRTSAAHPVWHPSEEDQLGPHRAFRWLRSTVASGSSRPAQLGNRTLLLGWHSAFQYMSPPIRLARLVIISAQRVVVFDRADRALLIAEGWHMTLPLADGRNEQVFGGETTALIEGQEDPFVGWHSNTYGEWHASPWLQLRSADDSFPVWGCGPPSQCTREAGPTGERLQVEFSWLPLGVTAVIADLDKGETVTMEARDGS